MSSTKYLSRVSTLGLIMALFAGPILAADDNKSSSKPISQSSGSSQSSRWGDRLSQMREQNRSSSSSASSSSNSSSYRDNTSSNRTPSYNRGTSNSNSGSSERNRSTTSSGTADRSRGISGSGSIDRSRPSTGTSSVDGNRGLTNSVTDYRNRYSTGSGTVIPNRGTSGSASNDRGRSSSGSYNFDRNRGSSTTAGSNSLDRNPYTRKPGTIGSTHDRDSVNRGNWTSNGGYNRDGLNRDQRSPGSDSTNRDSGRGGHSYDRDGKSDSLNRGDHDYDHDREHKGTPDKYRSDKYRKDHDDHSYFDKYRRYDSNRYGSKYYDRGYNPYSHGYYHRNYSNRRYYSHSAFSTIILGAAIGLRSYDYNNYNSGSVGGVYATDTEGYVELFEHAGFRGESVEIYAGEAVYNLRDIKLDSYKSFNDRFSSIKVFGNVTVVLYKDADLRGEYIYLNGSHIDFSRDSVMRRFNDEISSVEVIPGIVTPSSHGSSIREYRSNEYLADLPPLETSPEAHAPVNQTASPASQPLSPGPSVLAGHPQARVFLYDQPDYRGNQIVLDADSLEYNLARIPKGLSNSWDNAVASIRIEGEVELFLYTEPDYLGEAIAISRSVPNLAVESSLIPFYNTISSVVVNKAP